MNEEIDMELQFEEGLLFVDVDIDYEFDAPRYFELDREESPWEAQKAELWFEMAGNYPPSRTSS
ncbi:hypothetical protein AXF42_Ash009683 [Apostasia shenzhenica]|uniref:Uncharacterized protein n=1 Tax=Apostasia shenzhenica TaxID=1088818 RepID=A0A2I0AWT5_9ASPA|nr:hypothetical protein AXF42_Ash009683 [Apostasia shenzhenica]